MKRILDSSKTLTNRVTAGSKSKVNCRDKYYQNGRKIAQVDLFGYPKRSFTGNCAHRRDELPTNEFGKVHKVPERLSMYWSLDEENQKKVLDSSYVRQAVQETFMQRAQGAYHYRQPAIAHFPVHTSVSHKTTYAPTQKQQMSPGKVPKSSKPAKPSPPERHISKPQVPKRKRLIDTAKPVKHFISSSKLLQDRRKLGMALKESSETQLESVRKKLFDTNPAVLEYLMEKHTPRLSGYQLKTRKDKYLADTYEPPPPFVQRVFGWKKSQKKSKQSNSDVISITPRSIEVNRKPSGKLLSSKKSKKQDDEQESLEEQKSEKRVPFLKSLRSRNEKKTSVEGKKLKRAPTQAREDREVILNKMKSPAVIPEREHTEIRTIKSQVRDIDLTPQIYPRGSLSLRKSYLPIMPCRQMSQPSLSRSSEMYDASTSTPPTDDDKRPSERPSSTSSFTGKVVESFKSLMKKIRPSSN